MTVQRGYQLSLALTDGGPLSGRLEDEIGAVRDFHSTLELIRLLEELRGALPGPHEVEQDRPHQPSGAAAEGRT